MSWLSNFLNPGRGYKKGQEQLDKYYQQAQGYLQPYSQYGQDVYGDINSAMQALLNPQALQDQWSQGYHESQYAKDLEDMASQHGLNAASAMGLMGSTPALHALQQGTSQIAAADKQQYMNDLMQKYLAGAGIGQNIFGAGANAAGQMGQNAMNMGQNSAQMAYGQQNAGRNLFEKGLGAAGGLMAGALGGPVGASGWNFIGR
jgi:hypothetical protein